jgi:hypothetical protein
MYLSVQKSFVHLLRFGALFGTILFIRGRLSSLVLTVEPVVLSPCDSDVADAHGSQRWETQKL